MATVNNDGRLAYIYDQATSTWYALSGAVNTAADYEWSGTQKYSNEVEFESVLISQAGINNFQNPSERDVALPSPINGAVCFIRQTNGGTVINQVQYYHNGEWRYINDSVDIVSISSNYVLTKADAGKVLSLTSAVDVPLTVTIPLNSSVPFVVGQKIDIVRAGEGSVTISPATSGVIINSKYSNKKIAAQHSGASLVKVDTNTWLLIGDLTA